MLNQVVLVGKLAQEVEVVELDNGDRIGYITLELETPKGGFDYLTCRLWSENLDGTLDKQVGTMLGIKGRLEPMNRYAVIVVEKISYLGLNDAN